MRLLPESVRRTISGDVFRPVEIQPFGKVCKSPIGLFPDMLPYKKSNPLNWLTSSFSAPLHIVLLSCAAIISGCATAPTASIPIAVSCVKEAPAVPVVATEAEILRMTEYDATITVWAERLLLKAYALKADAILIGCQ